MSNLMDIILFSRATSHYDCSKQITLYESLGLMCFLRFKENVGNTNAKTTKKKPPVRQD